PDQVLRIRQLAAAALGAIGRPEALPALGKLFEDSSDARIRVSAAKAILEIINAAPPPLPFTAVEKKGQ
ncbi:MAG: HEAT repeat domain-containing protein, partial [Planctomycetes bacterium]|nr:HEAT repeat domain-containing protein [Planctomycetota bacterium]